MGGLSDYKSNTHGRAAGAKSWLLKTTLKGEKRWSDDNKIWTSYDWKYVIRSDESSFTLIPTSGRVYVWRRPKKAYNPEGMVTTVKNGGGSVMICTEIYCYSAGPIITLSGRITASDYMDILLNQVHPMFYPNNDAILQDDISLMRPARMAQPWFDGPEDALHHLLWPTQSPNFNIIEPLWSI